MVRLISLRGQALSKAVYFFRWKSAAIFIPPSL